MMQRINFQMRRLSFPGLAFCLLALCVQAVNAQEPPVGAATQRTAAGEANYERGSRARRCGKRRQSAIADHD